MLKTVLPALALALAVTGSAAKADEYAPVLESYLQSEISAWASDPVLVSAIIAQNAETAALSDNDILSLDLIWRAEAGTGDSTNTITPVIDNPAAEFLRQRVAASNGIITEAFVMDARGLNVAVSALTSDYWQGDEAKYLETFPKGAGAYFVDKVEFDQSSLSVQGQVSMVITDENDAPVGVITVGVDAQALKATM